MKNLNEDATTLDATGTRSPHEANLHSVGRRFGYKLHQPGKSTDMVHGKHVLRTDHKGNWIHMHNPNGASSYSGMKELGHGNGGPALHSHLSKVHLATECSEKEYAEYFGRNLAEDLVQLDQQL